MGAYCLLGTLLVLTVAVGESTNTGKSGNVPSLNGKQIQTNGLISPMKNLKFQKRIVLFLCKMICQNYSYQHFP